MKRWLMQTAIAGICLLATGCGSNAPQEMYPVSGNVKMEDGTVPLVPNGINTITFNPERRLRGDSRLAKGASGTIQEDGSYTLTTVKPGDGAFAGKYKVSFTISTYPPPRNRKGGVIANEYEKAETTPLEVEVGPDSDNTFDFELPPAKK